MTKAMSAPPDEPAIGLTSFDDVNARFEHELSKIRRIDGSGPSERDVARAEWATAYGVLGAMGLQLTDELADQGQTWLHAVDLSTIVTACRSWGVAIMNANGRLAPGWAHIAAGLAGARLTAQDHAAVLAAARSISQLAHI